MVDVAPDTAGALLDAAHAEVLAHGIRRTSASDIARRAGVSRQTLYRYWPDATALIAALVTRELLALVPETLDAARDLDELVAELVDTAARIRDLPLLDRLRDTDPELLARYVFERWGTSQLAVHARLSATLAVAGERGIVAAPDPAAAAATLVLLLQSAVQSAPLVDAWLDDAAWRRELARMIRGYLGRADG